jgi:hypothetical protein
MYDGGTKIAIFTDVVNLQANSYMAQGGKGNVAGNMGNFGPTCTKTMGAASSVQELRVVSQKQIEHEQHIKRLNQIINSLCEESKLKDKRMK